MPTIPKFPSWLFGTQPLAAEHGFPADNFGAANPNEALYHSRAVIQARGRLPAEPFGVVRSRRPSEVLKS